MKRMTSGGGWAAIKYTLRMANRVGWRRLWKAMRSKNACKTCALGMGGQAGGMRNEAGHWPEVCKKSLQAMVADMQQGLRPEFFQQYSIAQLKTLSPRELEWCGRLTTPLHAGPGATHYRPIAWDDALTRIAEQLKGHRPDENFFYASGRSSNEAGFLFQLFARLYGTNYVNNCSYYCHQASGVGLTASLGTGTATVTLEDMENADLFVLIGGNPASNHPRLMRTLMTIRRRGGHVIVVNPVKELGLVNFSVPSDVRSMLFGTKIASLYVQPHIGGDNALLLGVAKLVLERKAGDSAFIEKATEGFAEFAEQARNTPWDLIERNSGVERAVIERMADMYCVAKNVVFGWTMGITHHEHGVSGVQSIVNLALLRGMIGRPRAGLLPIRGHSNVQGIGSVGVTPNLKQQIFDNLEKVLNVSLPRSPGLDTMACMHAADGGSVRSAFCLGGNLFGSNPDAKFAHRALSKLDLVVYLNTTLNTGHAWGLGRETLILPVLARDEEPEPTTQESMFNFVRMSDGGPARRSRSDRVGRASGAGRIVAGGLAETEATLPRSRANRKDRPRLRRRRHDRSNEEGIPHPRPHDPRAAIPNAQRQGPVRRQPAPTATGRGQPASPDDGALRGAVQHGCIRGRGHLPRPGPPRRDLDEPPGYRTIGIEDRPARHGAKCRRGDAGDSGASIRHSGRQRADVLPGSKRVSADDDRPAIEDAGIQMRAGDD